MKVKKKKGIRTLRKICYPIIAILAVLAIVLPVAANMFSGILDSYIGRGKMITTYAPGTQDWDANYYPKATSSLAEAKANSDKVSEQVTDEGFVLLKNDGILPLAANAEVTPFGYAYLNPAYSGSGAAATTDSTMVTVDAALSSRFKVNTAAVNAMQKAEPSFPDAADGTRPLNFDTTSLQAMMDAGESAKIYEYDASIYASISDEIGGTTGLVFIKRTGSEGIDKRTDAYDDGTPHYLALTTNEKETIRYAKEHCRNVVVILNCSNPIELEPIMHGDYEADAILWIGTTGSRGFMSMAKILAGEVNPSGRLTDTYAVDFTKDPTYANFGEYHYTNTKATDTSVLGNYFPGGNLGTFDRAFVEYEEGIYVGYRYYETAAEMNPDYVYGTLDDHGAMTQKGAVAYPFGYGLSYTTFDQKITSFDDAGDSISMKVQVTNTGTVAGKDVVQIYYEAPYTTYDQENGIEKAAANLIAFGKTDLLSPGENEEVSLMFSKEDMASYSYHHVNEDGTTGCYLLEAGTYNIALKNNSHDVIESRDVTISKDIVYDNSNPRQSEIAAQSVLDNDGNPTNETLSGKDYIAATNEYQTLDDYMDSDDITQLSRCSWNKTFPSAPENRTKEANQTGLDAFTAFDSFDYETDPNLGNVAGSKVYSDTETVSGAQNNIELIDLRGAAYNDARWDQLLDEIDWKKDKAKIQALLYNAAYQTSEIPSVNKPATTDKDGAMGWSIDGASSWASANVQAATWNTELLQQLGQCIGEEALQAGLSGWYAPAVNIHRSPFSGRVYEYYSEDGLLTGREASATVEGCMQKGTFCYLKHMVLNDQETLRSVFLATWANEQAVREIYLKPFEIVIKDARVAEKYISDDQGTMGEKVIRAATGIMSSQNSIGGTIGFADYGTLTGVLRNEWGFSGAVITDLYPSSDVSIRDISIRAGSDMYMMQANYPAADYDSATARSVMRTAMHRILYMTANSNAMNGFVPGMHYRYGMSLWQKLLILLELVLAVIICLLIRFLQKRRNDEQQHPDLYWKKGEKKALRQQAKISADKE